MTGLGSLTTGAVRFLDYLAAERGREWSRRWAIADACKISGIRIKTTICFFSTIFFI